MVQFPNAKINLGLHVTRKRDDGYHDLETVFYPVQVTDALEIVPSKEFTFQCSGLPVTGPADNNLCVKAYRLLQKDFPALPPVSIYLHKAIPMGAGMGGGSADGAFMLSMINQKFTLGLTQQQLTGYALQLGSDCPFFIINRPCFATGRGELLTPVSIDLSGYRIALVNPGIHVSTAAAFSSLVPKIPAQSLHEIIEQPVNRWRETLKNDFEETVFALYPAIGKIKSDLYDSGAVYASMTGSGSTVFGVFSSDTPIDLPFPAHQVVITNT